MIKKLLPFIAAMGMGLMASTSQARDFPDIYTECGLGAMIAPNNSAVAAVTNVTWDLGTTAVSSNVSSESSCAGGKKKTAAYILQQYAQIEKDLARGQGPHLDALAAIAQCNAQSTELLRSQWAQSVNEPGYASKNRLEKARSLYKQASSADCQMG